jgi:hypothetical protein
MLFIYVRELQEETSIKKKHWKREKETYTGIPKLINMTSCREIKGR